MYHINKECLELSVKVNELRKKYPFMEDAIGYCQVYKTYIAKITVWSVPPIDRGWNIVYTISLREGSKTEHFPKQKTFETSDVDLAYNELISVITPFITAYELHTKNKAN